MDSHKVVLRVFLLALLLAAVGSLVQCGGGDQQAAKELNPEQKKLIDKFGLDPDKPYAGTELRFLICCHTAPQFASLTNKTNTQFEKLTGIKVAWGKVPFASFQEKVTTEVITGGGAYDLVAWQDGWGPSIRSGLAPLDDKIEEAGINMNDFPSAYQEASTAGSEDGTYYGIPLRGHPQFFFYRKDIYKELGLEPPKTWTEFIEQGEQIKQNTEVSPIGMYYSRQAGQNTTPWITHLWSNGGDIFDENYRPIFNSPEGVEATKRYVSYLREYELTPPAAATWNEQDASLQMAKGNVATFAGWWWLYSEFTNPEQAPPEVRENIGFTSIPAMEGGPQEAVSYGQTWPVGILQDSKNQEAAWEYIKWLTHPATEKAVAVDKSKPEFSTNVVVHLSNMRDSEVNTANSGLPKVAAEVLENSRTRPLIPEWPTIQNDVIAPALEEIAGGADVQATLDRAADKAERILAREGYYD